MIITMTHLFHAPSFGLVNGIRERLPTAPRSRRCFCPTLSSANIASFRLIFIRTRRSRIETGRRQQPASNLARRKRVIQILVQFDLSRSFSQVPESCPLSSLFCLPFGCQDLDIGEAFKCCLIPRRFGNGQRAANRPSLLEMPRTVRTI